LFPYGFAFASCDHQLDVSVYVADAATLTNLVNSLEMIPAILQKLSMHKQNMEKQAEESTQTIQGALTPPGPPSELCPEIGPVKPVYVGIFCDVCTGRCYLQKM